MFASKIGHVQTEISHFPYISLFLKMLSVKLFSNSRRNSYTKFAILSITLFYLRLKGQLLKHCKIPKYFDQDCLKVLFFPSTLPMMIQFLENMIISVKNVSPLKKLPISKSESFLESIFELNQISNMLLTQIHEIWKCYGIDLLYIFKVWINAFIIY